MLRTAEPDQPKPTLPDQSYASPASNPCVCQPQAEEKEEQGKEVDEMGVEEDKDEVDLADEDDVDWEEDGEETVEEDLGLEGKVRVKDELSDVSLPALAERQEVLTELSASMRGMIVWMAGGIMPKSVKKVMVGRMGY